MCTYIWANAVHFYIFYYVVLVLCGIQVDPMFIKSFFAQCHGYLQTLLNISENECNIPKESMGMFNLFERRYNSFK